MSNDRWIASWDGSRIIEWRDHGQEPSTHVFLRGVGYQGNDYIDILLGTVWDSPANQDWVSDVF